MEDSVRYARSADGARIAYSAAGHGPALAYLQVPSLSHIELYPRLPGARDMLSRLGRGRTLVRVDFRGTGMSQRAVEDHSPGRFVDDLEAVLDTLGIHVVDIVAGGARVTPALGFAVRHPGRVRSIVLGYPFNVRPRLDGTPGEPGMVAMIESNWELFLETTTQRNTRRPLSDCREILSFVRRCIDQRNSVATMRASRPDKDWTSAAKIDAPVLVIEFPENVHTPRGLMQEFADRFPNGRYMALPETAMSLPYGDGTLFLQAIEEFHALLDAAPSPAQPAASMLTSREQEILTLLASGLTQPQVATALAISPATVSRHTANAYTKIGVHRRAEAVAWAIHHGLA